MLKNTFLSLAMLVTLVACGTETTYQPEEPVGTTMEETSAPVEEAPEVEANAFLYGDIDEAQEINDPAHMEVNYSNSNGTNLNVLVNRTEASERAVMVFFQIDGNVDDLQPGYHHVFGRYDERFEGLHLYSQGCVGLFPNSWDYDSQATTTEVWVEEAEDGQRLVNFLSAWEYQGDVAGGHFLLED